MKLWFIHSSPPRLVGGFWFSLCSIFERCQCLILERFQKSILGRFEIFLRFASVLFVLLGLQQFAQAQTCQSEKLTVRLTQINYSGTDAGGPDPRVILTSTIGASTLTTTCLSADNVLMPIVLNPILVLQSQAVTCGAAFPAVTVSYKAHDDNGAISNCTVQPLLGEVEQTSATTPINISTIRTIPSRSIQQIVSVGAGATKWDLTFEVVWEQTVTYSACGITCSPNDSKGYIAIGELTAAGGTQGCTRYALAPSTTFTQCATVRSSPNGTLGVVNYVQVTALPADLATASTNTRNSRTGTERLYLKDVGTGQCSGAVIPKTRTGVNSSSFNPEWEGLTPNTDYLLFFTTTVSPLAINYDQSCINYYGITFPAKTVFNDDGKGGGGAGNCILDGTEDATTAPTGLYAKLRVGAAASAAEAVAVRADGSFAFASLLSGTYTIFLDDNATLTDVTSTLPAGWAGTATWTGTITSGIFSPSFTGFCLKNIVSGPCSGSHYVSWATQGWTAGALTKNVTLGGGLTMNTVITNPNSILQAGYPRLYNGIPSALISSNSASKSIVWTSTFNQKVSGVSFSIYDIDNIGTLSESIDIKGYNGATVVNPVITKSASSSVTITGTTVTGQINNTETYSPFAKANISFNQVIDNVVITYKNNKNLAAPRNALMLISDFSIYCPIAVVTPDKIDLAKAGPTGAVNKGDIITYTFRFNNGDATNKTVDFTDNLPAGFTWIADSYMSPLAGTPSAYGGMANFSITGLSVPPGVTTFTIDAKADGTASVSPGTTHNNQASMVVNGNTYLSDDPNQAGTNNTTPVRLVIPATTAPLSITKSVSPTSTTRGGLVTFTYTFNNTNASAITTEFSDELQPDLVTYKASSLVLGAGLTGTPNVYGGDATLSFTNLSIPVGASTMTVQAMMNNVAVGTYKNMATILPTSGGFRQLEMPSNEVSWDVIAAFSYSYGCLGSQVLGNFVANGAAGQTGTMKIALDGAYVGAATFTVTGTGFTGTLSTTIASGQSSVTIPITYDGTGTEGSRTLTVTAPEGSGTCAAPVIIQAACKAEGGRIGSK